MKRVEITMEKTMRIAATFEVTDEQLAMLKNGDNPFHEQLDDDIDYGEVEYDYAVCDADTGDSIVDWK